MGSLKSYLFSDLRLKLASILIALVIWLAITSIGEDKENLYVPISPKGLKKDLVLLKIDPEGVFLTVRGAISELRTLKKRELKIDIYLSNFGEGQHVYHIEKKNLLLPKGIKIEEIHPDKVTVEVDRIIKKKLRVKLKLKEGIEEKYRVWDYQPKLVEVEGAKKTLESRTFIETVPPDKEIEGQKAEVTLKLNTEGMIVRNVLPPNVRVTLVKRR